MINKKNLFQHSRMFFYVILGFVFLTQSLSCEDDWKPEKGCEQEIGPYPDYTQTETHIHVGDVIRFTYAGPPYDNYKLNWDCEGGQRLTFNGNVDYCDFKYMTVGSFKVTVELIPTKCSDYDTHFHTHNPSVFVEP